MSAHAASVHWRAVGTLGVVDGAEPQVDGLFVFALQIFKGGHIARPLI